MSVNGGTQIGLSGADMDQNPELKPFTLPVDDGSRAPRAETPTVSKEVFDKVILNAEIHGPRTVNPTDPSTPIGPSDKGTTVADPNEEVSRTVDGPVKKSAIGDHLASFEKKLVLKDASWIGADSSDQGGAAGTPGGTGPDAGTTGTDGGNKGTDGGNKGANGGNKGTDHPHEETGGRIMANAGTKAPDAGTKATDGGAKAPDGGTKPPDAGTQATNGESKPFCIKIAEDGGTNCPPQTGAKGIPDAGAPSAPSGWEKFNSDVKSFSDTASCLLKGGGTHSCSPGVNGNHYVNPDYPTSNSGHSLPDIDGLIASRSVAPTGLGLTFGLIDSFTGGQTTFGKSGLEQLGIGGDTSTKGSGGQSGGGHSSGGVKTLDDGSGSGSSSDIKGAATTGGSVAPPTGLDALMLKFGMNDFGAHLKDGSFDLDNFSAGAPSAKGPILDLDGNGQQDVIEWALSQIVSGKAEIEIVETFHSDPALAEFHQFMMDKYADMHIA